MQQKIYCFLIVILLIFPAKHAAFASDFGECEFQSSPENWQFEYHAAYRLTPQRTAVNTPTGHIQVQPISGQWDYQGTLLVYVDGVSVNLYGDSQLTDLIGKSRTYTMGDGNIDLWFWTGFDSDSTVEVKHTEDRYGTWYVEWAMNAACPNPDDNGPTIYVAQSPSASDTFSIGEIVPLVWSVTDSGTVTLSSLSLYQNGDNVKTLYQSNSGGYFGYYWFVADVAPGSGYHMHFFAVDDAGNFTEGDSQTFTIGSGLVVDIPGYWLGDPNANGTATPEVGFGVNSVSGNFYYEEVDAALSGIELPFAFRRSYNSQAVPADRFGNSLGAPLGWGWSHSYNIQLRTDSAQAHAEVIWDDGRREQFEKTGGQWESVSPGSFVELDQDGTDYAWRLKTEGQTEYRFDSSSHLTEIRSRTGHAIRMEYQGDDLTRIIDTAGRAITLSYDDGLLTRVNVPPSRNFRFEYTEDGFLKKVWDMRGNFRRFVYRRYGDMMMLSEIYGSNVAEDSNKRPLLQIVYDDQYRVTEQHTAHTMLIDSPGYLFDWSSPRTLVYNTPTALGATFYWNEFGQVDRVVPYNFPAGSEEKITYAATEGPKAVLPTSYNDLMGLSYLFSYDDPDSPNNPSQVTLPTNETYDFDYNSTHDLLSSLSPEGLNATYVQNTFGKPDSIDFSGPGIPETIQTDVSYLLTGDYKGQVSQVSEDGDVVFQIVSRSADGQPLEARHFVSGSAYVTTRYQYDGAGRLVATEDHRGTLTCFYYDENDNLTDVVEGLTGSCSLAPASVSVRRTHCEYDEEDRIASLVYGYGGSEAQTVNYAYNESGAVKQIDSENRAVQYLYDDDLRLFEIRHVNTGREDRIYQLGGGRLVISNENYNGSQSSGSRIERREYDENARLINVSSCGAIDQPDVSSSDCASDDRRLHFEYDDKGRVTKILESLELAGWNPGIQRATDYTYTDEGRTVTIEQKNGGGIDDGDSTKKTLEFDAAGRLIRVNDFDDATAYTAQAEYDGNGRVTKITDPSSLTTTYTYDRQGRPLSRTDLRGNVAWSYNDAAGTVTRTEPDGSTVAETYDRLGRLSQQVDSDGRTFSYIYNSRGWVAKELWDGPDGTGERNYTYNNFGELMSVEGPFDQTMSYARDTAGRISYRQYAGISVGYSYDAFGQIRSMSTPAGTFQFGYQPYTLALASIEYPNGVTTAYQRNPLGELESLTSNHASLGDFLQYGITLDAVGRRKEIQSTQPISPQYSPQELVFGRESSGLLSSVGNLPVIGDGRGNITTLPSPVAGSFQYDVMNRMTRADAARHKYDAGRNRIETVRNGETTRYLVDVEPALPDVAALLDESNQVQEIFIYGPGGLLASMKDGSPRFVHQDFNYNVKALTSGSGAIAGAYAYTPYGLPAGAQGETDFPFRFSGGAGVMTDPEGVIQMRARYYHPGIRQFTSADLVPGLFGRPQSLEKYGYIEGMVMNSIDPTGLRTFSLEVGFFGVSGGIAFDTQGYLSLINNNNVGVGITNNKNNKWWKQPIQLDITASMSTAPSVEKLRGFSHGQYYSAGPISYNNVSSAAGNDYDVNSISFGKKLKLSKLKNPRKLFIDAGKDATYTNSTKSAHWTEVFGTPTAGETLEDILTEDEMIRLKKWQECMDEPFKKNLSTSAMIRSCMPSRNLPRQSLNLRYIKESRSYDLRFFRRQDLVK